MRARPRTWPSMRCKRLRMEALASVCIGAIYPPRVLFSSPMRGPMAMTHTHPAHDGKPDKGATLDPVGGMTVDPTTTPHRHVHHDQTYYFCSNGCRTKFAAAPA